MALSANSTYNLRGTPHKTSVKVRGSAHIYKGAAVGMDPSGYCKPFEGGDKFIGFAATEFYNSSTTDGAASVRGDLSLAGQTDLEVDTGGAGAEVEITLAAVTIADRGRPVFAISDNSFALVGHPDGYIGRITQIVSGSSTKCYVLLKDPGDSCPITDGVTNVKITGNELFTAITAAGSAILAGGQLVATVVGSTFGSGSFGNVVNVAGGEWKALLGTTSEVENITIETALLMSQTYGMSLRWRGRCSVLGPTATTDITVGLMTAASSTMTTAIRADTEVTTSGIGKAAFHVDGDSANILIKTDDDTTVTSADTTLDNSLTVNKDLVILLRPSGVVEFYGDGVRLLSPTVYTVGSALTTLWGGIVNIEKAAQTDAAALNTALLEVKGASLQA